jgi:hypothetical protein
MPLTNFTYGVRGAAPVNVTSATVSVTPDSYAYRVITLNRAGGIAVTLPAATGSGDTYEFVVATTFTGSATIKVANANDTMTGTAILFADGGDTTVGFATGATADTVTMDGSTTGGLKGANVVLKDIAANLWYVEYVSDASGTEATPFSATV